MWKTFLILLIQVRRRHFGVFPMKSFHLFSRVFQPLRWFPRVFILGATGPFYQVSELVELLVYPSDRSRVGDYLTVDDSFNLPFQVTIDVLWFSSGLFSVGWVTDFIVFETGDVKYWVHFQASRDMAFERPIPSSF